LIQPEPKVGEPPLSEGAFGRWSAGRTEMGAQKKRKKLMEKFGNKKIGI
jgi:hypothetical protein